jgi:ParB family transcriptional regulator, chromosome partitioning protein
MSGRRSIPMGEIDRFKARLEERDDALGHVKEEVVEIPLALLDAAAWNARRYFSEIALEELRADIEQNGLIHPIVVRPVGSRFEVVVGERRFRAVKRTGLKTIRASIRHLNDREARRMGLSENLERSDLNDYEETIGWLDLLELNLSLHAEFKPFLKGKELAQDAAVSVLRRYKHELEGARHNVMPNPSRRDQLVIGTPLEVTILETFSSERMTWKSFVENRLPILQLPEDVLEALRHRGLEYTKARELAKIADPSARQELVEEVLSLRLPLTQIRGRVRALISPTRAADAAPLERRFQRLKSAVQKPRAMSRGDEKRLEALLREIEQLLGVQGE